MTPKERLRALLAGDEVDHPIVDLGTSTLTGLRPRSTPKSSDGIRYSDSVMHLPVLTDVELAAIGSHSLRWGASFHGADVDSDDAFLDRYGNTWIWADGEPAPLQHALSEASLRGISAWQRPDLVDIVGPQASGFYADPGKLLVVDAPTPGILDLSFRLRGYFELLLDMTDRWPVANALFDRALTSILSDYKAILAHPPSSPDIVVYGDDLAFQSDLYLSEERFAFFIRPRLSRLFSTIRSLTAAEIMFHSCGASLPVLEEVALLGVRIVNFEPTANGMSIGAVRSALGPRIVFHGVLDFVSLAKALETLDRSRLDCIVDDLVAGWPMIVAPADNVAKDVDVNSLRRAAEFVGSIDMPRLLWGDRTGAVARALATVYRG